MNNEGFSGAFSPGIDNESWTFDSVPVQSEEEIMRREELARRRRNDIIEWEMNHVDSSWGEKGNRRRVIVPPPTPDQISKRPIQPPAEFPDDRDINNYTVNDVNPVYGLDPYNLKLLDTITARTSRTSAAIGYINDTEQRLDLNKLVRMTPFLAKSLREVITEALTREMKTNLEIIATLNEYIYSHKPEEDDEEDEEEVTPTPTPTPDPEPVVDTPTETTEPAQPETPVVDPEPQNTEQPVESNP